MVVVPVVELNALEVVFGGGVVGTAAGRGADFGGGVEGRGTSGTDVTTGGCGVGVSSGFTSVAVTSLEAS